MSLRFSRWIGLVKSNDLDNVLLSREAEVVGDALAKKSYAKKNSDDTTIKLQMEIE